MKKLIKNANDFVLAVLMLALSLFLLLYPNITSNIPSVSMGGYFTRPDVYIRMLALFLAAGFLLQPLVGTVVSITTLLGEEYTVSSFTGEGVNIFRVLVCNVPLVLSYLYRDKLFADSSKTENLVVNLTMLNGAIMFVGLFGTANYFGRLANYFLIFQSLSLPWMLKKIGGRDRKLLTLLMVAGYAAYFYYANVLAIPFDQDFARLTVAEYFVQLGG